MEESGEKEKSGENSGENSRAGIVEAGTQAPDFTLPSTAGEEFTLSKRRGRNVVLAFYPGDWTPVCTGQLGIYNEMHDIFGQLEAEVVGISVDSIASHSAWAKEKRMRLALLADFEPKGAVAKSYGAYDDEHGTAARALFVIDKNGTIIWSYLSGYQVDPGADGILRALERIQRHEGSEGEEQEGNREEKQERNKEERRKQNAQPA
jgi:peroxiredoxin